MFMRNVLVLTFLLALHGATLAGSISAMRFSDGWYVFGGGDAAVASLRLPHHSIQRLELSSQLAFVDAGDGNYLYGVANNQVVSMRLEHNYINSIQLGDDIAVIVASGRTYLYALTGSGFRGSIAPFPTPNQVRVSGRLVLMSHGGQWAIAGAGAQNLAVATINGRPNNITTTRDTAVLKYSSGGTWVVSLGAAGFYSLQASNGQPSTVIVGGKSAPFEAQPAQ